MAGVGSKISFRWPSLRPLVRSPRPVSGHREGLLCVGYVEASLGVGESTRSLLRALSAHGMAFSIYPFNKGVEDRRIGPFMPERYDFDNRHDVALLEVAVDQLTSALEDLGGRCRPPTYTILRTAWELPRAPEAWAQPLSQIDEIWVPTNFVKQSLLGVYGGPIHVLPPAVDQTRARRFEGAEFGLKSGVFNFLFSFDFSSGLARKNPFAAVEAFKRAFPAPRDDVALVVKSHGWGPDAQAARARLGREARADRRILVVDRVLSRDETLSLAAASDCFLSLHRSEGFGFGVAEAMLMGKPAIGTDFSGTTDFLTPETGFCVPHRLRPVLEGEYPSGEGQSWAEPDIDAAAEIMREVVANPGLREARAAAGRAMIETRYSPANTAALVADRVAQIQRQRRGA